MATDQEIQAKREAVDSLRDQIAEAKQARLASEDSANRDYQLATLTEQETSLQAELAALRAAAPAAAPTPSTKAAPVAENKE